MTPPMLDSIAPQIVFFISFLIVFTLVELGLIWVINRLESQYWEFVIDRVIKAKVHHGTTIKVFSMVFLLAFSFLLSFYTPFVGILQKGGWEVRGLAVAMLLSMVIVYWTTTQKTTRLAIEKRIQEYLYMIVSLTLLVYMVMIADQSYANYKNYINEQYVDPAATAVITELEEHKKSDLLKLFEEMAKDGKCEPVDYSVSGNAPDHFIFVSMSPSLALSGSLAADLSDPKSFLKGRECRSGEDHFFLTDQGAWYWAVDNGQ